MRSVLCGLAVLLAPLPALAAISASVNLTSQNLTGGSDAYQYNLKLNNTGDAGIETLWYAWDDTGLNFLTQYPDNITAPAGWYGYATYGYNYDPNNGYSYTYGIEWYAFAPLASGQSLAGFSFQTNQTPADLSGNSNLSADPIFPIGTTFVYDTVGQGANGFRFNAVPAPVPEPASLGIVGAFALLLSTRKKRAASSL